MTIQRPLFWATVHVTTRMAVDQAFKANVDRVA